MNKLGLQKRKQIVNLLVEGSSMRAISRISDVSINTVTKLLIDTGKVCMKFHDENVKGLRSKRIQCDEIWSFVYAKQKNVMDGMSEGAGDIWTWTGMDADTKLMISWFVGNRGADAAHYFIEDVAWRLRNMVQLTTDGYTPYKDAVEDTFHGRVDFAQLMKIYGREIEGAKRYSPAPIVGTKKTVIQGNPDPKHISTSFVERQNLTMRMHMRRYTRLTNGFSKKVENHCHAIALHFVYYNFCRIHSSLRVTPAMEAGLTDDIMKLEDIIEMADQLKYENSVWAA